MSEQLILKEFKVEKAKIDEWNLILDILKEVRLTYWFVGTENYSTFYVAKDPATEDIVCCFSIDYEGEIGILKSFAVRKKLQKKGIGQYVVSKIPEIARDCGIKKLYATSHEAKAFWRKTIFSEIDKSKVKEPYILKYLSCVCDAKIPKGESYSIFKVEL